MSDEARTCRRCGGYTTDGDSLCSYCRWQDSEDREKEGPISRVNWDTVTWNQLIEAIRDQKEWDLGQLRTTIS